MALKRLFQEWVNVVWSGFLYSNAYGSSIIIISIGDACFFINNKDLYDDCWVIFAGSVYMKQSDAPGMSLLDNSIITGHKVGICCYLKCSRTHIYANVFFNLLSAWFGLTISAFKKCVINSTILSDWLEATWGNSIMQIHSEILIYLNQVVLNQTKQIR